jgi:hypothetical protein
MRDAQPLDLGNLGRIAAAVSLRHGLVRMCRRFTNTLQSCTGLKGFCEHYKHTHNTITVSYPFPPIITLARLLKSLGEFLTL